uniref:Uncharacterized protein n=1 Tax=Amphimedon queenslandica TaxID=400682 RepID=A0A1X7T9J6_AMPQE
FKIKCCITALTVSDK